MTFQRALGCALMALACSSGVTVLRAQPALPEGLAPPAASPRLSPVISPEAAPVGEPGFGGPALPSGLGPDEAAPDEAGPALPAGLGTPTTPAAEATGGATSLLDNVSGFIETRGGVRIDDDPFEDRFSLGEARLQLDGLWAMDAATFQLTTDFVLDAIAEDQAVDLETGIGLIDLRAANVLVRPADHVDLKIGRQILTWGVGDLIFINDLFPKDFRSFFIGRDEEYLKAPSDAARLSVFFDLVNVDLVYTPRFDADRYVTGERLSYFNPLLGRRTGQDEPLDAATPDGWFRDDEIALRLYRNFGAFEVAGYLYDGFWKSPQGLTAEGRFSFPALSVYGASVRGPLAGGIASAEIGYYDSRDDRAGTDPLVPNSEWRGLVGFERELASNLTGGLQYAIEHVTNFTAGEGCCSRNRHIITARLTKLALNQNLELSAFNFWSPNDDDGHLRLRASYRATDRWLLEGGLNIFYGPNDQAPFSSLDDNSNIFMAIRHSF